MGSLTYKDFKVKTDINDERLEKLKTYLNLIKIWQKKFNLISQKSFESIWERHFLDSYQILKLIGNNKAILVSNIKQINPKNHIIGYGDSVSDKIFLGLCDESNFLSRNLFTNE